MATFYFCPFVECDLITISGLFVCHLSLLSFIPNKSAQLICSSFTQFTVSYHSPTQLWLTLVHVNSIMHWMCTQGFCDISCHTSSVTEVKAASRVAHSAYLALCTSFKPLFLELILRSSCLVWSHWTNTMVALMLEIHDHSIPEAFIYNDSNRLHKMRESTITLKPYQVQLLSCSESPL
jgi:hypothetical protein